jgi:hypothetical protein
MHFRKTGRCLCFVHVAYLPLNLWLFQTYASGSINILFHTCITDAILGISYGEGNQHSKPIHVYLFFMLNSSKEI